MEANNTAINHKKSARPYQLKHRADIQGLRALAIFLVVFCHVGLPGFTGGFIGVDIFFVLSGYLITGLLFKEVQLSNKINFVQFYSRRLKRLLPALLTVLLATTGFSYFILAPFEQIDQAQAAVSVPVWLSNFYFSFSEFDYFASLAESNLYLHTWSLAVEEQFYLIWPVLIFAFLLQKNTPGKKEIIKQNSLTIGLVWIALISLIICIYWSFQAPLLAFYLMPSRAWQFAVGGIIFLLADGNISITKYFKPQKYYSLLSYLGITMIGVALCYLDNGQVYPGFYAILPTAGAALLIYSGRADYPTIVTRLLSLPWSQKFGDLSYSWYLWHWPVLILTKIIYPTESFFRQFWVIIISLLLAQLSYRLVESPIRYYRPLQLKPMLTISLSFLLMGAAFTGIKVWEARVISEAQNPQQITFLEIKNDLPVIYQSGCDDWYQSARTLACVFGDQNAEHTAVLIGDSVGAQWFSGLAAPLIDAGWRFIVYTKSSCPIVDEPIYYERIGMIYTVCQEWRDNVLSDVGQLSPDLIFIGNSAEYNYTQTQWNEGTQRVLTRLTPTMKHLFIIPGTHNLPFDGPGCLARKNWQPDFLAEITSCAYRPDMNASSSMLTGISVAMSNFPNVSLLDLNEIVCPNGICNAEMNNEIVYRDNQHLTDQFVSNHSNEIAAMIQTIYPF